MARVSDRPTEIERQIQRRARAGAMQAPIIGLSVSTVMIAMIYLAAVALAALFWGWPPFPVLGWPALFPAAFLALSAWGSWRLYAMTYREEVWRICQEEMEEIGRKVRAWEGEMAAGATKPAKRPKPNGPATVYDLDRYRRRQ